MVREQNILAMQSKEEGQRHHRGRNASHKNIKQEPRGDQCQHVNQN